ncbi:MAG: hypothetical protein QOJ09_3078 [Actinomycetota bacterium]|nr:hypothetical protein [Actinomycetota bacterium]
MIDGVSGRAPPWGANPSDALLSRFVHLRQSVATAVAVRRAVDANAGDPFRGLYLSDEEIDGLLAGGLPPLAPAAIDHARTGDDDVLVDLAERFELLSLDVSILLFALAPDLDPAFERFYGYLHDDVTRRRASVGLSLELAGAPAVVAATRGRFTARAPLVAAGLLVVEDSDRPFLTRSLRVPDRVTRHLLGDDAPDTAIERMLVEPAGSHDGSARGLTRALAERGRPLYVKCRPGALPWSFPAAELAAAGLGCVAIDLARIDDGADLTAIAATAVREARLCGLGLVAGPLDALADREGRAAVRLLAEAPVPTVLLGHRSWDGAWSRLAPLTVSGPAPSEELDATLTHRLTAEQVRDTRRVAALQAAAAGEAVGRRHLADAARAQNSAGLERLSRRIEPQAGWDALVLPATALAQLNELVARVRWRQQVRGPWGMGGGAARGDGVSALFAGDSGTGKTLAAEVVAGTLDLDLYVVDLATVVDKYIGETEKNLDKIFAEADHVNGVLLFDEADALFGKRSEVTDARDRYANVEIAYLLQRIERFDGIAILTTNLRANLDDAFLRRIDVLIDFPVPDPDARRRLWAAHLPSTVPLDDDVDLEFLSGAFELAGGGIRNVTLGAAYLAADAGLPLGMEHLIRATEREYRKLGRLRVEAEFGRYHHLFTVGEGSR